MTNVVLISTDQQRADSLGCSGNRVARTPHLDGLAARGALFLNHHTPNQICSPSRATLFSGRYARHHGLTRNGVALDESVALITHDFKAGGYATRGVGKFHFQPILAPAALAMPDSNAFWELPQSRGWTGPFYGFDEVDILIGESAVAAEAGHYASWLRETAPEAIELYRADRALATRPTDLDEIWKSAVPEKFHYNSWITDRACGFLEARRVDEPFFLFVSYPDPHHPFSPPVPWCDMFEPADMPLPKVVPGELDLMPDYVRDGAGECDDENAGGASYFEYLLKPGKPREQGFMQTTRHISEGTMRMAIAFTHGLVAMLDQCVGRILSCLSDRGLADDTLVIFTSDHGELLGDHGLIRKGPTPYRQLLQIPLIIAGPDVAPGERRQLTSHVDLRATVLEYLRLDGDAGDGVSMCEILREPRAAGRTRIFAEFHPRSIAEQYNHTLITDAWRLTLYPCRPGWGELFDRRQDPGEHRNLFHDPACTEVKARLCRELNSDWPAAANAGGPSLAVY